MDATRTSDVRQIQDTSQIYTFSHHNIHMDFILRFNKCYLYLYRFFFCLFGANKMPWKYFTYFFLSGFSFTSHRTAGEGGGHFFNSSTPLLPASQALRHQPGDYWRELTSKHSQQPDSNREPLFCECKSLTTKLRALLLRSRPIFAKEQTQI